MLAAPQRCPACGHSCGGCLSRRRAGGPVRTFRIGLNAELNNMPTRNQAAQLRQMPPLPALDAVELPNLIKNCVAACGGVETLQLHLSFPPPIANFVPGSWVVAMSSLHALKLCALSSPVLLSNTLEGLTALAQLIVFAWHGIRLGPAVELPQSLMRLTWIGDAALQMPAQVSRVSSQATTSPMGVPHLQPQA